MLEYFIHTNFLVLIPLNVCTIALNFPLFFWPIWCSNFDALPNRPFSQCSVHFLLQRAAMGLRLPTKKQNPALPAFIAL